jgi:hypothetical protein
LTFAPTEISARKPRSYIESEMRCRACSDRTGTRPSRANHKWLVRSGNRWHRSSKIRLPLQPQFGGPPLGNILHEAPESMNLLWRLVTSRR